MKVGVLHFYSWPGRRGELKDVYNRAMERVHIMDQNGYDAVWVAEHHFSTYSVCPSIHIMGTHIAAQTKNLRIGTGVSLAAFYNPVRLAEEVALLDVLSGGRVNWGAGSGFDETLATNNHPVEGRDIPVARLLAIAPTDDAAREVAISGAQWTTGSYMKNPLAMQKKVGEADNPIARYVNDVILWGCPERVADLIIQYEEEKKLNYLLCSPLSNQSFTLFNDGVLRRIQ